MTSIQINVKCLFVPTLKITVFYLTHVKVCTYKKESLNSLSVCRYRGISEAVRLILTGRSLAVN